jgi:Flp pilus assembly pilin Flp
MKLRVSRSTRGQAVVEYILLTALTALATVAIFRAFRADVSTAYQKAGQALVSSVDESVAENSLPSSGEE